MSFLGSNPELGYPLVAGLGLAMGSFLSVVATRMPRRIHWKHCRQAYATLDKPDFYDPPPAGVLTGRSTCPHCGARIAWYDNIPLLSYAVLGGRCRNCKQRISIMYPLLEIITALVMVFSVWEFGFGWQAFGAIVASWYLIAMSTTDIRQGFLPDKLTLPLMWLGLVASTDHLFIAAKPALIGAFGGYVLFWFVGGLFKQLRGKSGIGRGDYKMLAAIGAWVGSANILPTILISSVLATVVGGGVLLFRKLPRGTAIPYGPFLAIAGLLLMFAGPYEGESLWGSLPNLLSLEWLRP